MTYYDRAAWGAQPPKLPLTLAAPARSLVVHHTAGPTPASVPEAMSLMRDIQRAHQAGEYADIAYSAAVDQAGNLYEGRGMAYAPAATYGANSFTRAVVWLGNSEQVQPTTAALAAIANLWLAETGHNLLPDCTITGHRDWVATACPGTHLYAALPAIVAMTATKQEEDLMLLTWTVPDGRRYLLNTQTGAAPLAVDAVPAGADPDQTAAELVRVGACKDLGAVSWNANWVLRTAYGWLAG